jgi:hypothetical protein
MAAAPNVAWVVGFAIRKWNISLADGLDGNRILFSSYELLWFLNAL